MTKKANLAQWDNIQLPSPKWGRYLPTAWQCASLASGGWTVNQVDDPAGLAAGGLLDGQES